MRPAGLVPIAAVLGALASGCGGGDGSSSPPPGSIAVRDFEFAPVDFAAKAGEPVRWENEGEVTRHGEGDDGHASCDHEVLHARRR